MNKKEKITTYAEAFREEWELYKRCVEKPADGCVYTKDKTDLEYDPVSVGEVRLMVDVEPNMLVYTLRKRDAFYWTVIPISNFHNPASGREALVGNRVFQFWNKQDLSAAVLKRSLRTETLSAENRDEIEKLLMHLDDNEKLPDYLYQALGDRIRDMNDVRLEYLAAFSVDLGKLLGSRGAVPKTLVVNEYKDILSQVEYRMAAADEVGISTVALYMESMPDSSVKFKDHAFECRLMSEFMTLLPDDADRDPMVYTWDGQTPTLWLKSPMQVAAYVEKTGELFGRGEIDILNKRIVIKDFDGLVISSPIEKVSDIMLVVTPAEEMS